MGEKQIVEATGSPVSKASAARESLKDARRRGVGNYTVFHFKVRGVPFGMYRWKRNNADGFVLRVGPLGHVQAQFYRMRLLGHTSRRDGRRGKHGVAVHFWGASGRRRKRGIEVGVIL